VGHGCDSEKKKFTRENFDGSAQQSKASSNQHRGKSGNRELGCWAASRPERQGAGAASLSARLPVARRSPESAPCSRTAPPSVFSPLRGPAEHRPVKEEEFSAAAEEDTGTQFAPIIKLEEVAVTTGEEDKDLLLDM
jgi:hypothetical protein